VLFDAVIGKWVWFSDLIEGDYDDIDCIDMAFSDFVVELTNWDESSWEKVKPVYPKAFLSMSQHKRLLYAINYLKTHAT